MLHMKLKNTEEELIQWLVDRGRVHFGDACSEKVRRKAAEQLWEDRQAAIRRNHPAPGQAEYLDILRALKGMGGTEEAQLGNLDIISEFALKKYPEDDR